MRATRLLPFIPALLAIVSTAGCSSSGRMAEGERAVEGAVQMKDALADERKEVDEVLASLDRIERGQDLSAVYKKFNSDVNDLAKSADRASKSAQAMRERQAAYLGKWQKEMETLQDPSLRSTLEQRREAVRASYERVRAAGQAVREAYDPFMANLQEIRKSLSIDLTPQTVDGARPAIGAAKADGPTLKQKIAALQAELDAIQSGPSPGGAGSK
jgi:Protein of unknown function (DUF2959)